MSALEGGFAEVATTLKNSSFSENTAYPTGSDSITPTTTVAESSVGGDYESTVEHDFIPMRSRRGARRSPIGTTGYELVLADDGEGGTYFIQRSADGSTIAVFKPVNEEIGCNGNPRGHSRGCRVDGFHPGTGAVREVAAYTLDAEHHAAHVPITIMRDIIGKGPGSFQQFIPGLQQSWNMSSEVREKILLADIQYLALFDIRVFNTDRHGGNILVHPSGSLTAIDHSYILPHQFVDPEWEWLSWPESRRPIQSQVREYYLNRNDEQDAEKLRKLGIDEESVRFFLACSAALRIYLKAFPTATLIDVAEVFRRPTIATPSIFEQCLASSRAPIEEGGSILQEKFEKLLLSALH